MEQLLAEYPGFVTDLEIFMTLSVMLVSMKIIELSGKYMMWCFKRQ